MAPSFEAISERLPSLYRPGDDDLAVEPLSITAADVAVRAQWLAERPFDEPPQARLLTVEGGVSVELPEGSRLVTVFVSVSLARAAARAVTLTAPAGLRPFAVATLDGIRARFPDPVTQRRFTIGLRRRGVLSTYLEGIGDLLDHADRDAAQILYAHWWAFADNARYSPYHLAWRGLGWTVSRRPIPPLRDGNLEHFAEHEGRTIYPNDLHLERFDYIHDLARLAAPIPVVPWREQYPREQVEAYRLRIRRIVELHRDGLGTLLALQRIVEAELPLDPDAAAHVRDRGFVIEEFVARRERRLDVRPPGSDGVIPPLEAWTVDNTGVVPTAVTIEVEGVTPRGREVSATAGPEIELHGEPHPVGLAYRGTLEPGRVLRLRPAYSSWLGRPGHWVDRCRVEPDGDALPDPAAPGPWARLDVPSTGATVAAIAQTSDGVLWFALVVEPGVDATGAPLSYGWVQRWDGRSERMLDTGSGPHTGPRCLARAGRALLLGTDAGLWRIDPFDPDAPRWSRERVGPVRALAADGDACRIATATGALERAADGTITQLALGATPATQADVTAVASGAMRSVLYGTDRGVFEHQTALDHWYWYAGGGASETEQDWQRFDPDREETFPQDDDVFLPPVRSLLRARDGTLWIGTSKGLARYVALPAERLAFTTTLQAFPELGTGPVHTIAEDPHGVVWFGCAWGLMRADHRDLWHYEPGGWRQLGRMDAFEGVGARGTWRFHRASQRWQRADPVQGWVPFAGGQRTVAQAAVHAILWTDEVAAEIGGRSGDGTFSGGEPLEDPDRLELRVKPSNDRVVTGGIPALPRLAPGRSTWRYLELERSDAPAPPGRPTWTREGRRIAGAPAPPDVDPVVPARLAGEPPGSTFGGAVFSYPPSARVSMTWRPPELFGVAARLRPRTPGETIEPAVLDRVHDGMSQVRPAGVRTVLAIDETIVRGA